MEKLNYTFNHRQELFLHDILSINLNRLEKKEIIENNFCIPYTAG